MENLRLELIEDMAFDYIVKYIGIEKRMNCETPRKERWDGGVRMSCEIDLIRKSNYLWKMMFKKLELVVKGDFNQDSGLYFFRVEVFYETHRHGRNGINLSNAIFDGDLRVKCDISEDIPEVLLWL